MIDPLTTTEIQSICGVATSTVHSLKGRGIFVQDGVEGGEYMWHPDSLKNYIAYLKKRHGTGKELPPTAESGDAAPITDPENEYRRQKARKERLLADQLEGSLVPLRDVTQQWETHVFAAKAKLLGVPGKLTSSAKHFLRSEEDGVKVMRLAETLIVEALAELTKEIEDLELETGDDAQDAGD